MPRRLTFFVLLIIVLVIAPVEAQEVTQNIPAWVNGFGRAWFHVLSPGSDWLVVSTTTGVYRFDTSDPDALPLRLEGHTDTVRSAAFNRDGTLAATTSLDGTVRLWRLADGEALWAARIGGPCCDSMPPTWVEFSGDGSLLLVFATDAFNPAPVSLFAVNARSGQVQALESGVFPKVVDDGLLLPVVEDGAVVVRLLRAEGDGFAQSDLVTLAGVSVSPGTQLRLTDHYVLVFSESDTLAAARLDDGTITLEAEGIPSWVSIYHDTVYTDLTNVLVAINLETGARVDLPKQHFSGWIERGQEWLLYRDLAGTLTGLNLSTLRTTPIAVNPVLYQVSGDYVLTADASGTIRLTDLRGGYSRVLQGAILPEGATLAWVHVNGGTVFAAYGNGPTYAGLWDVSNGSVLVEPQTYNNLGPDFIHEGANMAINGRLGDATGILLADLDTRTLEWFPFAEWYRVAPLVFGPGGLYYEQALSGVALLDLQSGESAVLPFEGHTASINDLVYNPDGTRIASASEDGTVRLWDATSGAQIDVMRPEAEPLRLAFTGDELLILMDGGGLRTWGGPLSGADAFGMLHDIDARGSTLAASGDQSVQVFDVDGGALALRTTLMPNPDLAPVDGYHAVALDPAGRYIVAGGLVADDKGRHAVVDLWDAVSGAFVTRLESATDNDWRMDLSFNADGSQLALTAFAATVWNLDGIPDEPVFMSGEMLVSSGTFVGDRLAYLLWGLNANPVLLRDAEGVYLQTFWRNAHSNEGGGGGLPRWPVAARPDGSQIVEAEVGGAMTAWNLPPVAALEPLPEPAPVSVVAYCDKLDGPPDDLTAADSINVEWSWYATELPLIINHLRTVTYEIMLDGQVLSSYLAQRSVVRRDPVNDDHWTIYYTLNVGALAPGEHTITYRATWRQVITDGLASYGPGTVNPEDSGACRFMVR